MIEIEKKGGTIVFLSSDAPPGGEKFGRGRGRGGGERGFSDDTVHERSLLCGDFCWQTTNERIPQISMDMGDAAPECRSVNSGFGGSSPHVDRTVGV
jgi:hypothetical protein